jgi:uncharacterized protein YbjT (DUF2867 family)
MAKIIVIIGATGTQGGSIINTLTASKNYYIRGVTRNVESEKSQTLIRKGIEIVHGDLDDYESLLAAFKAS